MQDGIGVRSSLRQYANRLCCRQDDQVDLAAAGLVPDLLQAAGSDFLSNTSLERGSTGYVESLVRLQGEAAGDDFLLDLCGAAEDRLDMAERPGLLLV